MEDHKLKIGFFTLFTLPDRNDVAGGFHAGLEEWLEEAEVADRNGFDVLWMAEHHFQTEGFEGMPNQLMFAAAAAQRTKKIRFGTAGLILPQHHPVRLAEDIALCDHLVEGRLEIGLSRGFSPRELEGLGAPSKDDENRVWFAETLEIMLQAWSNDRLNFQGTVHRFPRSEAAEKVMVLPKTYQKPHPPLWQTVYSKPSIDAAAKMGMGMLLHGLPIEALDEYLHLYQDAANSHGQKLRLGEKVGLVRDVYVAPTDEDARDASEGFMREFWKLYPGFFAKLVPSGQPSPDFDNADWETMRGLHLIHGNPQYCVERLSEVVEKLPVEQLIMHMYPSGKAGRLRSLELFATKVRPELDKMMTKARTAAG